MEQKMKMGVIESRKIKRIRTEKYDRKGSATVEAAFLLPLLLALFMLLTETAIFFYNRAAAVDLAGQAVIHGAQMEHAGRNETEDKILKEMQNMGKKRLVFLTNVDYSVSVSLWEIKAQIRLERKSPLLSFFRGMGFQAGIFSGQIEKKIKRLNPSKVIWELHRIRQISNHAKREDRS